MDIITNYEKDAKDIIAAFKENGTYKVPNQVIKMDARLVSYFNNYRMGLLFKRDIYSKFDNCKNPFVNSPSIKHGVNGNKSILYPENFIAGYIKIPSLIEVLLVMDEELAA